jgi:hypothetical protein
MGLTCLVGFEERSFTPDGRSGQTPFIGCEERSFNPDGRSGQTAFVVCEERSFVRDAPQDRNPLSDSWLTITDPPLYVFCKC